MSLQDELLYARASGADGASCKYDHPAEISAYLYLSADTTLSCAVRTHTRARLLSFDTTLPRSPCGWGS